MTMLETEARALLHAERHRCKSEGRDFDVADALAAIRPLLEDEAAPPSCPEEAPCEVRQGLSQQLARAFETNAKLNRRCQAAESAALENIKACVSAGLSFGRTLANWYALRLADELRGCIFFLDKLLAQDQRLGPTTEETAALRKRIEHALPEAREMERWRAKHTQPKASSRDA